MEKADRRAARLYPAPPASSPDVRKRMRATGRRDTKAELALRRELHRRGLRYRVDAQPLVRLRRRADIVFSRERVAVFCDGCYWHGCSAHGTWPTQNATWWRAKIETNMRRDADTTRQLEAEGWAVVRVWEHEAVVPAADRVEELVRGRRRAEPRSRP